MNYQILGSTEGQLPSCFLGILVFLLLLTLKLATHQSDFGSQRPSEAVGHSRRPTQVGVSRTVVSLRHLVIPPAADSTCWMLPLVDWSICGVFVGGRRSRRRRRSWRRSRDAFGTRSLVSGGCVAAFRELNVVLLLAARIGTRARYCMHCHLWKKTGICG